MDYMKAVKCWCALTGVVLLSSCATVSASPEAMPVTLATQDADRAQIEGLNRAFTDAWNKHDMRAFADLFHADAEWVNWRGGHWSTQEAIYEGHRAIHETYYRNTVSTLRSVEALHFMSPTIAYLRVRTDMTGDERTPGQTHRYRRMMLVTKKNGVWRIAKGHNTRIAEGVE